MRAVPAAILLVACCVLSGCADSGKAREHATPATLTVHIGLFGGPFLPGRGMAASDTPAQGKNVTAVDAAGRKHVARTDAGGSATLRLAPGAYTVFSTYCGTGPQHIALLRGRRTRVQIDCPVP